jgi:hypothetical protein
LMSWEPQHLTHLWALMACYRYSFTFIFNLTLMPGQVALAVLIPCSTFVPKLWFTYCFMDCRILFTKVKSFISPHYYISVRRSRLTHPTLLDCVHSVSGVWCPPDRTMTQHANYHHTSCSSTLMHLHLVQMTVTFHWNQELWIMAWSN